VSCSRCADPPSSSPIRRMALTPSPEILSRRTGLTRGQDAGQSLSGSAEFQSGDEFSLSGAMNQDWDKWDVRGDVNLGTKDNMFWRFSASPGCARLAAATAASLWWRRARSKHHGDQHRRNLNHIFTLNFILSVRGAWNYGFFTRDSPAAASGELLNQNAASRAARTCRVVSPK
jgi:hypothetical protein